MRCTVGLLVAVVATLVATGSAFHVSLGMNIDPTNTNGGNATSTELAQAGAAWVRIEYKDTAPIGHPPTPASLSLYASKSAELHAAGIQTLLIVDYSSLPGKPAASASNATWAAYRAGFASYVCCTVVAGVCLESRG